MTDRSARPLIVEFLGLPGSGKTTLARRLAAALIEADCACAVPTGEAAGGTAIGRRLGTTAVVAAYIALSPGRAVRDARRIVATQQPGVLDVAKITHTWWHLMARYRDARSRSAQQQIVILDQGIYQALWSIAFRARREALTPHLERLVRAVTGPDVVVDLVVDDATARGRLERRARVTSRLQQDRRSDARADFARASAALELVRAIAHSTPTQVTEFVTLNTANHASLDPNVRSVASAVLALRGEAGRNVCNSASST